ncbi:MAG: hypothetical protein NTW96_25125 [Planctomycetia bacterium]|nr:hypothetical protein [Planctomycetia bacterium]
MGLLAWLFGGRSEDNFMVHLPGPGTFSIDVVGESKYQPALEFICGGRTGGSQKKTVEAVLVYEDDNPYDDQAIRVDIQGNTVGYLSRDNARQYRKELKQAGYSAMTATCSARIVGGWDHGGEDRGLFGVTLDLPTAGQHSGDSKRLFNASEFEFSIVQPNAEELSQVRIGDSVKLWAPADAPTKILIYRHGSLGGDGRLGLVPKTYAEVIANHRASELPIETEVCGLTTSTCSIRCRLVQAEEVNRAKREEQQKLRAELTKPYRPKKPVEFSVDAKSYVLNVGERLRLTHVPSIDECVCDICRVILVFTSMDGKTTIKKGDEPAIKKKIVRLTHTFDDLDIQVISRANEKHWYKSEYKLQMTPVHS